MKAKENSSVQYWCEGDVGIVRLNRPERRNAIDRRTVAELHRILEEMSRASPRVVIFTGAEGVFAAGADIGELLERGREEALEAINTGLFRRIEDVPVPTIAAVRGFALGGGCELALACDLRVAGEGARFGQPEVGLGIVAGAGGCYRLARLVGIGRARELLFTGRLVDAREALSMGLVEAVVPDEDVDREARDLAARIVRNDALAVRLTKAVLGAPGARETAEMSRVEVLAQAVAFESPEKFRRMRAFLEKKTDRERGGEG